GVPVVTDDGPVTPAAQPPAQPDGRTWRGELGDRDARRPHRRDRGLAEQPLAVGGDAAVEMEAGEGEQVAGRGGDQPGGPDAARQAPDVHRGAAALMAYGGTAQDRLLRQGDGLGGGERTGQPLAEGFIPGPPV